LWSDESLEGCLVAASKITQQKSPGIRILDFLRQVLNASGYSPQLCSIFPSRMREAMLIHAFNASRLEQYIGNSFLALATRFGLVDYLDAKVPDGACCKLENEQNFGRFALRKLRAHTIAAKIRTIIPDGFKSLKHDTGENDLEPGQWPLFLAACFSGSPNVNVWRLLLERGARYDMPWDFDNSYFGFRAMGLRFGKEESILPVILSAAVLTIYLIGKMG